MVELDLGRLLRLKGMIESAASTVDPAVASAPALTESYSRMRAQVFELVNGSELSNEFSAAFPKMNPVSTPSGSGHPSNMVRQIRTAEAEAQKARTLLGQLAGWLTGLIEEQTLTARIKAEAAERIKQQRGVGFAPSSSE